MNELQIQKNPNPSSVRIYPVTREWLKRHQKRISDLIRFGPNWYDTMVQQAEELRELRENMSAAQKKLSKLYEENDELRKFKERTMARLKTGEVQK